MCPFCLATLGLIAAGAASTGGMAALVVKGFPARRNANAPDGSDGKTAPKQITQIRREEK